MRKDAVAEWILCLVMPRERASAAVGDLLEDSAGREPSWFWTSIAGTIASTLWRETQTHGWRLTMVSAAGFFLLVTLSLGANFAALVAWKTVHFLRDHTGLELLLPGDRLPLAVPVWLALFFLRVLVPFEVGRWVARHSQRRELAACFVMILLWPALADLTKSPYDFGGVTGLLLIGAILERCRANRGGRPMPGSPAA